jgi:hypothetical protein
MASHLLGVLEPAVVLQVNRDTGCPPGVTSHRSQKTRRLGPLPNRSPGVVAIKSSSGHCRSNACLAQKWEIQLLVVITARKRALPSATRS